MTEDRYLREAEVKRVTGLSRTTRFELERDGRFPKRRQLAPNAVGWLASEIDAWVKSRPGAVPGTVCRQFRIVDR